MPRRKQLYRQMFSKHANSEYPELKGYFLTNLAARHDGPGSKIGLEATAKALAGTLIIVNALPSVTVNVNSIAYV